MVKALKPTTQKTLRTQNRPNNITVQQLEVGDESYDETIDEESYEE